MKECKKDFLPKDVEIAATSNIIEKKSKLGAHPGTEENYDKLLYTFLTKKMHTSVFFQMKEMEEFHINHKKKTICAIYDEIICSFLL